MKEKTKKIIAIGSIALGAGLAVHGYHNYITPGQIYELHMLYNVEGGLGVYLMGKNGYKLLKNHIQSIRSRNLSPKEESKLEKNLQGITEGDEANREWRERSKNYRIHKIKGYVESRCSCK